MPTPFDGLEEPEPHRPRPRQQPRQEPRRVQVVELNLLTLIALVMAIALGILAAQFINGMLAGLMRR